MHPQLNVLILDIPLTRNIQHDSQALLAHHGHATTAAHSLRVAAEAKRLALRQNEDPAKAEIAGWLHDISAIVPRNRQLGLAEGLEIDILPEERTYPLLLHQKLSAVIAREVFAVTDPAILSAIECHTTLKANSSALDRIIFVADKLKWDQPGDPPYLGALQTALEHSLDAAALCYLDTLWQRRATLPALHPWVVAAYQELSKAA
jgi:predicted HD superfamily hydrolase involved in NAD metabolism